MTNQSPLAFQVKTGIGFPALNFPVISPGGFYEPLTFTSPELSARMAKNLQTCKLNDFKLVKKVSNSLAQRNGNGLTNART